VFQWASPDLAVEKSFVDVSVAEFQYVPVDSLVIDGHCHQTWQEAIERDIVISGLSLVGLAKQPTVKMFSLEASRLEESLTSATGAVVGRIVRRQQAIIGKVTVVAWPIGADLFKLHLEINNATPLAECDVADRDEVLLSTFISTHVILRTTNAEFVSLLEPPDALRLAADTCLNVGLWPVLAGEPGRHDHLLASPIILYDYPQVAPESSGDWCDGAEIDEMLALRVMTLTGDEKRAMRDVDRRARQILERTESLSDDQMLKLHGTFRGLERNGAARPSEEITP
jgi:hydrogenase maturation protease